MNNRSTGPRTTVTSLAELTKSMNPPQQEAVDYLNGPLLILAGAGSGKTRVLTFRTANIISQGLASSDEILAVTFTNKAAKEMESRIAQLLRQTGSPIYGRMWISTFHSICARILREHIHLLDYKPFFGIYDTSDQLSMIKKCCSALNIDEKSYPAKGFAARINNAKTEALSPDDLKRNVGHMKRLMDDRSLQVYEKYEQEMRRANSLDFGDLLMKTYVLFRDYPAVLEIYQRKFKYIMVDEYQDTNRIQYLIVQMLASGHRNLCVVGDEDQSIYSWRGADINNILDFEKDFSSAKVVKLEQNYRSTQTIINAATHVIRNNTQRKDKTLFTENLAGDPIIVREEMNEYDEARFVANEVAQMLRDTEMSPEDVAVFYRTNAQSRVLEEQFRTKNIAYRIVGGVKFYERMEIKDILGYMKLILNPSDDVAFKRVINVPARGIGKTSVDRLEEFAASRDTSLLEGSALAVDNRELNSGVTSKLRGFLNLISSLREAAQNTTLPELYHAILDGTQYVHKLKEEDTPEAEARIENLEELDNAIAKFSQERGEEGTLQSFLEEMSLVSDQDALTKGNMNDGEQAAEPERAVTMMTLHISKGLEYPVVFVVGLEENLFPSGRATEENGDPTAIEEERRLCYVGMTRAEKKLYLTYARTRKVWGNDQQNPPSRFLKELPKEGVVHQTSVQKPRFMDRMRNRLQSGGDFDTPQWDDESAAPSNYKRHPLMDDMPNYEDMSNEAFDESGGGDLKKGMRVRHPTYGVGSVFQVEGGGPDLKVSVVFGDNTVKKFVAKYARLERV